MANPFQIISKPVALTKDPVCGMMVDPAGAATRWKYQDHEYAFCALSCFARFRAEPERYLHPETYTPEVVAGTEYTCPMHPEVTSIGPGACPLCGMALEPKTFSGAAE